MAIWKCLCRLCGHSTSKSAADEISLNLLKLVDNYLGIDLSTLDYKICDDCVNFLNSVDEYMKKVNKIDKMFEELETNEKSNIKCDLDEIFLKYIDLNSGYEKDFKNLITKVESSESVQSINIINGDDNIDDLVEEHYVGIVIENELNNALYNKNYFDCTKNEDVVVQNLKFKNKLPQLKKKKIISKNSETNQNMFDKNCGICGKTCRSLKSYNKHMTIGHKENINRSCDICCKKFGSITKLKLHKNTHLPPEKKIYYECEYCEKKYSSPSQVKEHVKDKHLNICKTCKKKFPTYDELKVHTQTEHSRNIPPCEVCGKTVSTHAKLKSHEKTHIPLEERELFHCTQCTKKFTTPHVLRYHIKGVHCGEKNFICDNCGKGFPNKSSLDVHMETHKDEVHTCDICQKEFKHQIALKKHKKVHSTKKYPCNICNAVLKSTSTLRNHMVVHSNEKKFECTYCGKLFNRDKNLKVHMIIHTNLKPYQCPFCSQSYSNRSNCKKHQEQIHPKEFAALEAQGIKQITSVPTTKQLKAMFQQMKKNERCGNIGDVIIN